MTDYPYKPGQHGLLPDLPDSRNIMLGAVLGAPGAMPAKYSIFDQVPGLKAEDQNGSLSCVGQTFSKYSEILNFKETGKLVDLSAKWVYSRIRLPGGAAYLMDGAKQAVAGICTEALDPSYPNTEAALSVRNEDPKAAASARIYKGKAYVSVPNTVASFKQAIMEGHGCPTGMNVSLQSWGQSAVHAHKGWVVPPGPNDQAAGHAFLLGDWDDTITSPIDGQQGAFRLLNSWGQYWGTNGRAWIGYNHAAWLFGGWTILDAPNEIISDAKSMYNLRRAPGDPNEIYAIGGGARRHIVNLQTLQLGNVAPDRYWVWDGTAAGIPVATAAEWAATVPAGEILILPNE